MTRNPRRLLLFAAIVQGGWMLVDGIHALVGGNYFGPRLGPWAPLVAQAGIDPLSAMMKSIFVALGIAWLAIAALLIARARKALVATIVAGVLTLWFLPFGTLLSTVAIVCAATQLARNEEAIFRNALQLLSGGSFSRLKALFDSGSDPNGGVSQIHAWFDAGRFRNEPEALAEVLTCACFLGDNFVALYLLTNGVDVPGGAATGLDALHWAANRGHLSTVEMLIFCKAPLEARSMYDGTVLGTAVWSAINEPRRDHLKIIETLLKAGARVDEVEYPTGDAGVDAVLQRYRRSTPRRPS